jgi:chromosomal replication initiator protein
MKIELAELWKSVLAEIEVEVSRANFLTLFKPTVLLSLEGKVATVAAPSSMIIDLLQRRFYEIIKKALVKQAGDEIEVVFIPKTVLPIIKEDKVGPLFEALGKKSLRLERVRPEYTFENMAVSSSNQLAYVAASTVAKKLGEAYNPLFIYGSVGVGKTHLMQAIANEVYKNSQDKNILYLTSEEFTNEVVEAIRTNSTSGMKKRFRTLNLLIIDDIQFVAGKEKVQEELFHTFNILVDAGAQIVLSSDKPPAEMKKVEQRLTSRFSGGLTVDIEPPDYELRAAILLIKAKKFDFDLPMEMAKIIAEKDRDGRSLEGILLRIITEAKSRGGELTEEILDSVLNNKKDEAIGTFHPDEIIKNVCDYYNIKPTQLKGAKRDASLVKARQVAMFLLKRELGLTFNEIGGLLGGRDHTTIMYGVGKMEGLTSEKKFIDELSRITKPRS